MDILTIDHLTKVYGSGPTALKALDDVSFSVAAGEFVAIVGSSGSGKSTLLHLMGGVDRPTSGTVLLNGADVYARSDEELAVLRRRDVGLVYQFYNLIPVLNVVENASACFWTAWDCAAMSASCPISCQADSNSAWPSGARS